MSILSQIFVIFISVTSPQIVNHPMNYFHFSTLLALISPSILIIQLLGVIFPKINNTKQKLHRKPLLSLSSNKFPTDRSHFPRIPQGQPGVVGARHQLGQADGHRLPRRDPQGPRAGGPHPHAELPAQGGGAERRLLRGRGPLRPRPHPRQSRRQHHRLPAGAAEGRPERGGCFVFSLEIWVSGGLLWVPVAEKIKIDSFKKQSLKVESRKWRNVEVERCAIVCSDYHRKNT